MKFSSRGQAISNQDQSSMIRAMEEVQILILIYQMMRNQQIQLTNDCEPEKPYKMIEETINGLGRRAIKTNTQETIKETESQT